jgi:hypothetical protein
VIEVNFSALYGRKSAQVFVIRIVLEKGYPIGADAVENFLCYGRFAGTRSAGDADDQRVGMLHA